MAKCSPRSNRVLSSEVDLLMKHLQEVPVGSKPVRRAPGKEPAASAKHIQSVEHRQQQQPRLKRQMSTRIPSPEASFIRQFEQQVSYQKKAIHCQRKESMKENNRRQNLSVAMDIVDWVKMRSPEKGLISDTIFERQHQALEKLINRNNRAMNFLVHNRSELLEIDFGKKLRRLG